MNQPLCEACIQRDLTSATYWDRRWFESPRPDIRVKRWLRKILAVRLDRPGTLYRFLVDELERCGTSCLDVLEIGCAPGEILTNLQRLRPKHRFHGIDFAPMGIEKAREKFASIGRQATLHHADVREFKPAWLYDFVYSCGLIEHFSDPLPVIREHVRLCQPGGRVAITVPNYLGTLQRWFIKKMDPEALKVHNFTVMDPETLRRLMIDAGLHDVRVHQFSRGIIRPVRGQATLIAELLGRLARIYNEFSALLPSKWLWYGKVGATGCVPKS
jgi:2-polyprenyl-3-methyl-5-hydroxy-6-metoxy-1,4-benzoquinol methylase